MHTMSNYTVVLAGAVLSLLACLCSAAVQVRLCVTSEAAMSKCEDMVQAFDSAGLQQLVCIEAPNVYTCMRWVKIGKADIVKVDDTDIYTAAKLYSLIPILRESSTEDPGTVDVYMYKAVVLIRANSTVNSLADLRGRKSCHTGVGKTVGWTVPVANLQALGVMEATNCDNTVKNVAAFFTQSCAPGAYTDANNIDGDNPANVCQLCQSDQCPVDDPYADYSGAVQCLLDGRGDVAFAKHSTIDSLADQNPAINKNDFLLLCPDGTKKHVDEWSTCNWATRPTDVIMTEPSQPTKKVEDTITLLISGARQFNSGSSAFNMFNSSGYQGDDVIFTDEMKQFQRVNYNNLDSFLGVGYMNTMTQYQSCSMTHRWCVVTMEEEEKCKEMAGALAGARITSKVTCIWGRSRSDCMERIRDGQADLTTVTEGEIYTAGSSYNLVPVVAETYEETGTTSYWSVAVVKKSNTAVNINNLKGKTSCHTGVDETSGWTVPIGTLIKMGSFGEEDLKCGLVKAVSEFFSSSCIPGALYTKSDTSRSYATNLCELCGGKDACQKDDNNQYYGDKGAFRCLVEKNADVAFIKHTTVLDNTDGKNNEEWARILRSEDFELLCRDGSRKSIDQWQSCSLARIPSNVVVTNGDKTAEDKKHYASIMKKGELMYGRNSTGFELFSSYTGQNLIFSDLTSTLYRLTPAEQDYTSWLGGDYSDALAAIGDTVCTSGQGGMRSGLYFMVFAVLVWFWSRF